MTLRRTLSHIKNFLALIWHGARNWRTLWKVHTQVQESDQMAKFEELQELNEEVRECDACSEHGECEYHRERFENIKREVKERPWWEGQR